MGFGDDLRGELFGKLGVEQEGDPLKLIEQAVIARQQGNNQGAKKTLEQALEIAKNQAAKYEGQSQHRAAAEAYYIQSMAEGHLGLNDKQSQTYKVVIERLLDAGKSAIAFSENSRGIACATLAGMVALMDNDQLRAKQIYTEYIGVSQQKEDGAHLQKLLYSLGYLLDALENDNIGGIADAQNFISTDLKPMLSTAKLVGFGTLLETVLTHTQETLQGKITMPKLQIGTSLPRDIQFNQLFDIDLDLNNTGDGVASSVVLEMEIPSDIEVVDGKPHEQIATINPESEEKRNLKLRFQTGDTSGEQVRQIKGSVSYVDMLGNSHKQYFGPIELEFTAISKKEEFQAQLKKLLTPFEAVTSESLHENVLPITLELYSKQVDHLKNSIGESITNEEFGKVIFGLTALEKVVDQIQQLTQENEITAKFDAQLDDLITKVKNEYKEELAVEFEEQKKAAVDEVVQQKTKELDERVEQLKRDLSEQYTKDLNEAKDKHQQELQQANRDYEQKLNQALVQHENKLKDEFKDEKTKLVEKQEQVIKDIQNKHQEELETEHSKVSKELTTKYESRISELENSRDEMKTQLVSQYDEDKAKELANQKERLTSEKETAVKQKEDEVTARLTQEFEEKLAAKDREIEHPLKRKIKFLQATYKNSTLLLANLINDKIKINYYAKTQVNENNQGSDCTTH